MEESLKEIAFMVRQIITIQGDKMIDAANSDEDKDNFDNFVKCLHVFYTSKENILINCFQKNVNFSNAFWMAYQIFLNKEIKDVSIAQIIA